MKRKEIEKQMEELIDIEDGMLDCLTGISYQIPLSDEEVARELNVLNRITKKVDIVRRYIECLQCGYVDIIHYNASAMDMTALTVLHIDLKAEQRQKLKEEKRYNDEWFDNLEEVYLREPEERNYDDSDEELIPDLEVIENWINQCKEFRNAVYTAKNKVLYIADKKGVLEHIKYHIVDGYLMELCRFGGKPFHRYVNRKDEIIIDNDYYKKEQSSLDTDYSIFWNIEKAWKAINMFLLDNAECLDDYQEIIPSK